MTYPFSSAYSTDGNCCIVQHDLGHFCGYVKLDHAVIPSTWRGDYNAPGMQFLAIHGGITYAKDHDDGSVFGFDCNHSGDASNDLLRQPGHIMALTLQMRDQLIALALRHTEFTIANRERKAAILDEITATATIPTEYGLGGMIELLSGAPSLGDD